MSHVQPIQLESSHRHSQEQTDILQTSSQLQACLRLVWSENTVKPCHAYARSSYTAFEAILCVFGNAAYTANEPLQ